MEVTQKNLKEVLPRIINQLKGAEFVSYDLELTGLGRSHGLKNHDLDTPEERYLKDRSRVMDYGITQIGLSIFKFCQDQKKYYSSTFCFFLSGKVNGSYRYDASSMTFLAENGFDFNKLFTEGLPFMSLVEEQERRDKRAAQISEEQEAQLPSPVKIKDDDKVSKKFVKDAINKITDAQRSKETVIFSFASMTGFHRKLLYNNVAPKFPTCSFRSTKERDIQVVFFESEQEKTKMQDVLWEEELNDQLGFSHVVKALLESNVPLVGHNIYLDVLHFVDKFIAPLPESYKEFKTLTKANLNCFYDTKLISKDPPFSEDIINTALGNLYTELTTNYSPPNIDVEDGCHSYKLTDTGQAHDGGYDAFMTGICFITMLKTLEKKKWANNSSPMKSRFLSVYANRINFMGSYDIPFLDINKPEVIPKRNHIYSVQCPSSFNNIDIRNLFMKLKSYKTLWVHDTQLYVIPQDESDIEQVGVLLKGFQAVCPSNVHVNLYNDSANVATNGKPGAEKDNKKSASTLVPIVSKRTQEAESDRNLKRLKSIGSDQLSNLSLDSPMEEDSAKKDIKMRDLLIAFENLNFNKSGQEIQHDLDLTSILSKIIVEQQQFRENIFKQLHILSEQNVFIYQKVDYVSHDMEKLAKTCHGHDNISPTTRPVLDNCNSEISSVKDHSNETVTNFLPKDWHKLNNNSSDNLTDTEETIRGMCSPTVRPIPRQRVSKLKK